MALGRSIAKPSRHEQAVRWERLRPEAFDDMDGAIEVARMNDHRLGNRFLSSFGEVAYDAEGEGPNIVLVHGTPASSLIWRGIINRLKSAYRLHFLDLPGYGASEKIEGQEVRLRAFARVLREFIEHLGLERPHLVGHDFGAATVFGARLVEGVPVRSIAVADGVVLNPWGTPFSLHVQQHEKVFAAVPDHIHRAMLTAHLATAAARPLAPEVNEALIAPWTRRGRPAGLLSTGGAIRP